MKLDTSVSKLPSDALKKVTAHSKELNSLLVYLPMLQVLAETCDMAATGEDIFVTIGTTRKRNALVLTVTYQGDKTYVAGEDFELLCGNAVALL